LLPPHAKQTRWRSNDGQTGRARYLPFGKGSGNILRSPVLSIYRWKEKIESAREVLLVIKTSRRRFPALQAAIKRLHSYEVPEIIALPIAAGSRAYLSWLAESLAPKKKT
jgi:periplasmic divalent cation tolerance protein